MSFLTQSEPPVALELSRKAILEELVVRFVALPEPPAGLKRIREVIVEVEVWVVRLVAHSDSLAGLK